MEVKDLILYQIATNRDYKVGDKFHVGDKINYTSLRDLDCNFKFNDERLVQIAKNYKEKGIQAETLISEMSKKLDRAESLTCQLALEFVRQKYFSNLPSRFTSMYFSTTTEECFEGYNSATKRNNGNHYQIVACKLNGRAFYSRTVPIIRPGWSFLEYCEFAKKYWGQVESKDKPVLEVFFEGNVEIVDIIADSKKG